MTRGRVLRLVTAVLIASGCTGGGSGAPASANGGGSASAESSAEGASSPPPGQFLNPVLSGNFADPMVLAVGGTFHAYATGDITNNLQVATSSDLVHWQRGADALPKRPAWQPSANGLTWAPEVAHTESGYVMYYTARDASAGKQCVSYAVASSPAGPFEDANDEPFICQRDLGGSIDPSPFVDSDGRRYLLWKNDGNCCGITTSIWIAELAPDGRSLRGKPRDVGASNDQTWEGRVVEGPNLVLHDGTYYLFYSANDYASAFYAVGYATSRTVTGPYTDAAENPILATKGRAAGPGGQTVVEGRDGRAWMLYHAWDIDAIGDQAGGERSLWLDRLEFVDGKAVVHGPTDTAQPEPMP